MIFQQLKLYFTQLKQINNEEKKIQICKFIYFSVTHHKNIYNTVLSRKSEFRNC